MSYLIGIAGAARVGKDTLAKILQQQYGGEITHFADTLKQDLDDLLIKRIGHSAFSEDPKIKEMIRPLLVCYGTEVVRNFDDNCWLNLVMDHVDKNLDKNFFISDVRFPNEVKEIQSRGGQVIHISRYWVERTASGYPDKQYFLPKNKDERANDPIIQKMADILYEWEDFKNDIPPEINFDLKERNDKRPSPNKRSQSQELHQVL